MIWLAVLCGAAFGAVAGLLVGRRPARLRNHQPATAPAAPDPSARDVVEEHRTAVVVAGPAGQVILRNAAARALAGTHVGVLIDAAVERHVGLGLGGVGGEEIVELYGPPKRVVDVVSHPLPGGGAVVFVDDITERRRLDQVRTDFVANISHELKTPIGALSVLAETLVDEDDPATVKRIVDRMMGEAERASRTIDDLMELSRIELGGERAHDAVKLADVLRAALDRVTELAGRRDILVTLAPPGETVPPLVIDGDRRQLVSAVGNLVENAVKYSEAGGIVDVRLNQGHEWIEIAVIDQGVGIPQRDLNRIFERFYRVDRARSRETGGTGLGLSIVRHVATNHDGDVLVTSVEGQGSTFVLRLPARLARTGVLEPAPDQPGDARDATGPTDYHGASAHSTPTHSTQGAA